MTTKSLLVFLALLTTFANADVCKDPTEEQLQSHMTKGAAPDAGTDAGNFTQLKHISDFADCVSKCCGDSQCNAVFFSQKRCFTISCFTDEGCKPKKKSLDAILINLRSVDETRQRMEETTEPTLWSIDDRSETDHKACELGILLECDLHEECVPTTDESRSKNGVCQCVDGYIRDTESKRCVKGPLAADQSTSPITTSPIATSPITTTPAPSSPIPSTPIPNTSSPTPNTQLELTTDASPSSAEKPSLVVTTPIIPAATDTVPKEKRISLVVSAGENKVLEYPDDSVTLTAYALPEPEKDEVYTYRWSFLKHPSGHEIGQKSGMDQTSLKLSKLVPGLYTMQVNVTGPNKFGSATVNITVLPEPKANSPPVAVITPTVVNVQEGATTILDGSESTDDKGIEKYYWDIVRGPIEHYQLENNEGAMLKLKDLPHGTYDIRLTVTDADELKNSTLATVNVEQAVDYPPKANAGDDKIVFLPVNSIDLYGNSSSDDKGIVSYEWISKSDTNADIKGVHEPVLHLTDLRQGDYTFELEVTDTAGQKDSAEVHVYVKASENKPPKAAVTENVTRILPDTDAVLDGSPSSDDNTIAKYKWTQVSGPNTAKIDNSDRPKASVGDLIPGDYVFKLTVYDSEDLHDETTLKVLVREPSNSGPKADAGPDKTVTLPVSVIKLDGSKSTDDGGPITYKWSKSVDSPAAGSIVDNSDNNPVLMYSGVVAGNYTFILTVTDEEDAQAEDKVTVHVKNDPDWMNVIELSLDASVESFTEKQKTDLVKQLGLLLPSETVVKDTRIDIKEIHQDYHSGKLVVLFDVLDLTSNDKWTARNGTAVKKQLRGRLSKDSELLSFAVAQVDTAVCQNTCSGHGYCDQFTRKCVCELLWMPNYFKVYANKESNCDWSVLYVVIILLASIVTFSAIVWLCLCCTRRCRRGRNRRKHTYQLLHDIDEVESAGSLLKKKSNISTGNGSIFLSETDLSSEDDTLFMNGGSKIDNSNLKKQNDLAKANNLRNKLKT